MCIHIRARAEKDIDDGYVFTQDRIMQRRIPHFIKSIDWAALTEKFAHQIQIARLRGTMKFFALKPIVHRQFREQAWMKNSYAVTSIQLNDVFAAVRRIADEPLADGIDHEIEGFQRQLAD